MKIFYKYIILLFSSVLLSDEITLIGDSPIFVVDTKYPITMWISPSGGEAFDGNETILLEWSVEEESLISGSVSIYLSTTLSPQYDLILSNLGNYESINYTLPDISTNYGRFKVQVIDDYGYLSESESGHFTISGEGGGDEIVEQEIIITGDSPSFAVDTKSPEIELLYPNGGENFTQGEQVNVTWSASDNSPSQNPITISLSIDQGSPYETIVDGISNSGLYSVTLPMQESDFGRFKIHIVDSFGYQSSDEGDGYFIIGVSDEYAYSDTSLTIQGDSESFITDTVDPVITVIYPNGGEHVLDYENVNLQWTVEDESIDNMECSASVTSQLGGYYIVVDDNLPVLGYENSYNVNMNQPGVEEALWARLKMDITDEFGNSAMDKSDNYFILGDPEGEMEAQTFDEESSVVLLDWGWQEDQLIVFQSGALSFLSDGDMLAILDNDGIVSPSCESATGVIELDYIDYTSEMNVDPLAIKVNQGEDYCEYEGGSKYPGYILGNNIIFQVTYEESGIIEDITPYMGETTFDGNILIITGFQSVVYPMNRNGAADECSGDGDCNIGLGQASNNNLVQKIIPVSISGYQNMTMSAWQGGRDFDDYNIYRSTNIANLRECGGTCGTCSDDLTFNEDDCIAAEYIWTDLSFEEVDGECICLIAEHTPQTWYFDNFSMQNTTWCYHVWLMDDDTKLVKTVESCTGLEILMGDLNGDGALNVLDVVNLVNCVLAENCPDLPNGLAGDMNADGAYNILDVVILINNILFPS